ncbi:MAG: hypothetical protein QW701_05140 [Candidatus Nezhaarchaeales archaeon]
MIDSQINVKYLISTSLRPSRRMRTFGRDLAHALIYGYYVTRGKRNLTDLRSLALSLKASRLIVIQARKGNPSKLDFYDTTLEEVPLIGSINISGVKLVREQPHVTRAPSNVKIAVCYEPGTIPPEIKRSIMLIPTLFDLEVSTSQDDRWVVKISWREKWLEISFIDRETTLFFGPTIRVRNVVLSTT